MSLPTHSSEKCRDSAADVFKAMRVGAAQGSGPELCREAWPRAAGNDTEDSSATENYIQPSLAADKGHSKLTRSAIEGTWAGQQWRQFSLENAFFLCAFPEKS